MFIKKKVDVFVSFKVERERERYNVERSSFLKCTLVFDSCLPCFANEDESPPAVASSEITAVAKSRKVETRFLPPPSSSRPSREREGEREREREGASAASV